MLKTVPMLWLMSSSLGSDFTNFKPCLLQNIRTVSSSLKAIRDSNLANNLDLKHRRRCAHLCLFCWVWKESVGAVRSHLCLWLDVRQKPLAQIFTKHFHLLIHSRVVCSRPSVYYDWQEDSLPVSCTFYTNSKRKCSIKCMLTFHTRTIKPVYR